MNNYKDYIFKQSGTHRLDVTRGSGADGYDFEVDDVVLIDMVLEQAPYQLTYQIGDEFNPEGMVLMGVYNNGKVAEVTHYEISGFDSSCANPCCPVSVTCGNCCVTIDTTILGCLYTYMNVDDYMVLLMYHGKDSRVCVPDNINGFPVRYIESTCFNYSTVEEIVIPNTVQAIY